VDQQKLDALTQQAAPVPKAATPEKPKPAAEPSLDQANEKLSNLLGKKP
jgi:hypothetical protein